MAVNIPGAAAATQTYALFNPLDLYQDEIYNKLIKRVPTANSLSWMRSLKGRMKKRKSRRHTYSFYEEGQFMKASAKIASITPNGAKFDIVLSAADHSNLGGTGKSSFPVKNMTVLFKDGKTTGFVESVTRTNDSAHMVTVKKTNPSSDIGTVATVGSTMVFYGNAQPERSTKTESRVPQFEKITNQFQEIREGFEVTDFEMQNALWFEAADGKRYCWYKGLEDTAQRFELETELTMLVQPSSSGLTDANNNGIQTMSGLDPQIEAAGTVMEYFNKPDGAGFDELILAFDANYGEKNYIGGHGINVMVDLKNFLVEFAKNGTGNVNFSPFDGGEKQALSLDFKSYSVGAYSFHFQQWDILSHQDTLGAEGLPFRHTMYLMPAGMTRNADPERQPGDAEYEPYIQMVSPIWGKALNANIDKGDYLMWETGALASTGATSDELVAYVHMVRMLSLEIRCRNKFFKWVKA